MTKESAMQWLWGITILNLGLGALLWVWNFVVAENNDYFSNDYSRVAANAILWQAIGANLFSFGVLALVITLATAAITSTQLESSQALVTALEKKD
jgi:hypothetical protein